MSSGLGSVAAARQCDAASAGSHPTGELVGVVEGDGVHEITADGTVDARIAGTDANTRDPAWSPDGTKVAFSEQSPSVKTPSSNLLRNLVVADVESACWTPLSQQRNDILEQPVWSPDAKRLVYLRHAGGTFMVNQADAIKLETSNADGSGAKSLVPSGSTATWAPDGSGRMVFSDSTGLKLRQADGRVIVLDPVIDSEFASWSPDATRIMFSVSTNSAVWTVNPDGSGLHALTQTVREGSHAFVFFSSWSPDGSQIAFTHDCCLGEPPAGMPPGGDVWVMNADGSNAHAITSSHDVRGFPRWSPSGSRIAYETGIASGRGTVVVVQADGTQPQVVAHDASLVAFTGRAAS